MIREVYNREIDKANKKVIEISTATARWPTQILNLSVIC